MRSVLLPIAMFGAGLILTLTLPAIAKPPTSGSGRAPASAPSGAGSVTTIVVASKGTSLLKVAVATPEGGDAATSAQVNEIVGRDLTLSSMFEVLDPRSFTNRPTDVGSIAPESWRNVGANAVILGKATPRGNQVHLELNLFVVAHGSNAVLKKAYDIPTSAIRATVHQFDNEVVKYFTGTAGSFGGRLVFSSKTQPGRSDIFSIDSDGFGLGRLPTVTTVALCPSIGPQGIYYSGGLPDGSYQLFKVGNPVAVLKHAGLVFSASFSGSKMAVVISQNGQSDIWVGGADGTGLSKATHGGQNIHPAFGPGGQLAYVSDVGGSPQIYLDGKRISPRGDYNMAPVFCNDPEGLKILFMGRDGDTWDLFSVDPGGGGMKRLTQDQGSNKYPACSPDGRTVAFFSTRGGLYTSNVMGVNQQKVASVMGEGLRWAGN